MRSLFKSLNPSISLTIRIIKVVCAFIQNAEGLFLLVQRAEHMPHGGEWEFPGGKIKANESPETALKRELKEELNITVRINKKGQAVVHQYPDKAVELLPFFCSQPSDDLQLNEHSAFRWVNWEELPLHENLLAADVDLLRVNNYS